MSEWLQILVNGLIVGGIYALVALGYTMVYGVLKFINFAHGEVVMVGAYVAWLLQGYGSMWLGMLVAMVVFGAGGWGVGRGCYRPLRGRNRLVYLITAVGVSLLLQSLVTLIFGARNVVIRPTEQVIFAFSD